MKEFVIFHSLSFSTFHLFQIVGVWAHNLLGFSQQIRKTTKCGEKKWDARTNLTQELPD